MMAWTITKSDHKECLVIAESLEDAVAALPSGSKVQSARLLETYQNTFMSYGSSTAATPMPVIVAGGKKDNSSKSNPKKASY